MSKPIDVVRSTALLHKDPRTLEPEALHRLLTTLVSAGWRQARDNGHSVAGPYEITVTAAVEEKTDD